MSRLSPSEFTQPGISDSEVVADFVDHGSANLLDHLVFGAADRTDGPAVDRDAVGEDAGVRGGSLGQWDALIQPE